MSIAGGVRYPNIRILNFIYLISFQLLVFPMIEPYHTMIAFIPTFTYFISNLKLNRKIFFIFARLAITHLSNGYMIIHPLRKALVEKHQMLCEERFDRLVAKAQILPGAFSLNLSAVIGRELNGRKGAVSALLGSSVPLVLLFSLLITIFSPMRHWSLFHSLH